MVSLDYKKDYYAVLEVPATAGEAEIKRQFHKLARLYHPDRNIGKENEYAAKFQVIQEAHEILSDSERKSKYDAYRRQKLGSYASSVRPPQRSNFPRPPTTGFPPPPQRPEHRSAERPASSTNIYEGWTQGQSAKSFTASQRARQDESRAQANAWAAMKANMTANSQARAEPPGSIHKVPPPFQGQQRPAPPPRGPTTTNASQTRRDDQHPDRRQNKSADVTREEARNKGSFQKPKRPGYDPNSLEEVEPPVITSPSNYRTQRSADSEHLGPDSSGSRPSQPSTSGLGVDQTGFSHVHQERQNRFGLSDHIKRTTSVQDAASYFSNARAQADRRNSTGEPQPFQAEPSYSDDASDDDDMPNATQTGAQAAPTRDRLRHKATGTSHNHGTNPISDRQTHSASVRFADAEQRPQARSSNSELRPFSAQGSSFTFKTPSSPSKRPISSRTASRSDLPSMHTLAGDEVLEEVSPRMPATIPVWNDGIAPPAGTGFQASNWQGEDWSSRIVLPDDGSKSPTRPTPGLRRSKTPMSAVNPPGAPQPASIEQEESGPPDGLNSFEPMDLDTDPVTIPAKPTPPLPLPPRQEARPVHVAPMRSEWRSPTEPGSMFDDRRRASLPHLQNVQRDQPTAGVGPNFNLQSFQNVAPFQNPTQYAGSNATFENLKTDLSADLPFQSQASSGIPILPDRLKALTELPRPPEPPQIPTKHNNVAQAHYLAGFYTYLAQWNAFYLALMDRFQSLAAGQAGFTPNNPTASIKFQVPVASNDPRSSVQFAQSSGIMPHWATARGETKDQKGWPTYLLGIKEEARLRSHLNVCAERHQLVVEAHDKFRERLRSGNPA